MGLIFSALVALVLGALISMIIGGIIGIDLDDIYKPVKPSRDIYKDEEFFQHKMAYYSEKVYEYKRAILWRLIFPAVSGIVIFVGCLYIGYRSNYATIVSYDSQVQTYTAAVQNPDISGLEKISLVEQIVELNSSIKQMQETSTRWYGFLIPEKVNELTTVDLSSGE